MYELINQLLNGLSLGAMYALIAVGYTMVYGIIKLINFAHGEFLMFGAFVGYFVLFRVSAAGFPPFVGFLVAALLAGVCAGALAVVVDVLAYRPVRPAGRIAALLTAIGASLLLQNVGLQLLGAAPRGYPPTFENRQYPAPERVPVAALTADRLAGRRIRFETAKGESRSVTVTAGPEKVIARLRGEGVESVRIYSRVSIDNYQMIVLGVLIVSGLLLWLLVNHTQAGRAMRAVSFDREAASLMGINVNRTISLTFFVGAFLAGVCGVLVGMSYNSIDPQMGLMPGLKAFVAAVVGGIGRIPGAILGGFAMGITESLVVAAGGSSYRDAIAFGLLIMVLLVRPQGLVGQAEDEKV